MITRLSASTDDPIDRIGGKATGLVRLLRAGLPVPAAWSIPAQIALDPAARDQLIATALPDWWNAATAELPGALWAVRSSAVAEDLDNASFAGVYETVLGVDSLGTLIAAVRRCWAAVDSERAAVYRAESGIEAEGIALVLQRMLRPRAAGVLLTCDPLRPFDNRIVIDAAWGLGDAVVSGVTDPDHIVLARSTGAAIRYSIGAKQLETVWDSGLRTREVDPARRERACLDDSDLRRLHAVAQIVGDRIGARRDLEWAIEDDTVQVLQDRAITGLPSETATDMYSRRYGDEYLADYYFPLTIDLCLRWIEETRMEVDRLVDPRSPALPSTRMHHGYAYISANWLLRQTRALPMSARATTLPWFPPMMRERILAEPFDRRRFLATLRAPYADRGRGSITRNPIALQQHCATVERLVLPKITRDYSVMSADQLRADCAEVDRLGMDHFRVIRWGMATYSAGLHSILSKLLSSWCSDESGALYEAIISGLPETMTARINREIYALGRCARANPQLRQALLDGAGVDRIRVEIPDVAFWAAFDAFLVAHGHRAATRDIGRPRWRETPADILAIIAAQVRPDSAPDPAAAERAAVERRTAAERTALQRAGRLRRPLLRKVIRLTQLYTEYRENQRYHLDYLLTHLRNLMLEYGRRFTERGLLAEPSQVFYLHAAELWHLADGGNPAADLPARLAQRHEHWLRHRDRLPATYLFDDVEVDEAAVEAEPDVAVADGCLRGAAACRGIARGVTKVVRDLGGLAAVETGDILVAANIDPGWTSVFPIIGGLVTSTGGTLSHGAILAREYGIPTVTGVKDAVTVLPTGTRVEIDGGAGTVTISAPGDQLAAVAEAGVK